MERLKQLIKEAMDEFIIQTGGNLDRRASFNRDRKALLRFVNTVLSISASYTELDVLMALREIEAGE